MSNVARALGFAASTAPQGGVVTSEVVLRSDGIATPRVYLDTVQSKVQLTLDAGIDSGLNITIGIGPLEVSVVNDHAKLSAGVDEDGDTIAGPARIGLDFADADGVDDGEYDVRDLFAIAGDADRSFP